MAKTITTNGDAQVDTAQSKFGGASGLFDGTGDYLSTPNHADFSVGSGDFTIDCWIRLNSTQRGFMFGFGTDSATSYRYQFDYNSVGTQKLGIWASSNGTSWDMINADSGGNGIGATTVTTGAWHHVAYVRNGNNFRIYLDGVSDLSITVAGTITDPTSIATIGRIGYLGGFGYFDGWIDEFRFSKGIARWTANFTPETSAYTCADSYTKLLIHADGADASTTFTDDDSSCVAIGKPISNMLLMGV